MLNISRAEIAAGCYPRKLHVRPCKAPKDLTFDGIEASRGKAAMGRKMGDVGIRAEAKRNEVDYMLCHHVVGERIKLRAEPVRRLDLLQEKFRQLVRSVDGAYNLFFDVSADVAKQFHRHSNAPPVAIGKLGNLSRLVGTHQNHLS